MHDSGEGHVTAGGQAPTHGGPVSARGVSRLAWSGAITAIVLVATSVALFVQGAGRLEDFGGPDALAAVAYSVVGALVVSRRPDNPPLCRGPDRLESVDGPLRSQQRAWRLLENRHGWSRGVNSF